MLLYLAATCCGGRHALSETGQRLDGVTVGAVCAGRYRGGRRLGRDPNLAATVGELRQGLTTNAEERD